MSQENTSDFAGLVRAYADSLKDLFDITPYIHVDRLFEFVCTLVRSEGLQDAGWDPYYESEAVLEDLRNLSELDLPADKFSDPERTRVRLALLSYCHLIEMDLPYDLIANLLRLKVGMKYQMDPFVDLARPIKKEKRAAFLQDRIPPSPKVKINRIRKLAENANLLKIAEALDSICDNVIRNAVDHSDYVLHDNALHLLKGSWLSKKSGCFTARVEYDELEDLVNRAFAFYMALFSVYERCRRSFVDFKNAFLPYDGHYKGVMELLIDKENRLIGYRVYWPNRHLSEYFRTKEGCSGQNITFNPDGSINFMVGIYSSMPGSFSPLVDANKEPIYPARPGTDLRPYWPEDLRPYRVPGE